MAERNNKSIDEMIVLAQKGNLDILTELAQSLTDEQRYQEAFYWLQYGANMGQAISMVNLALFFANGISTKQDSELALYWFNRAACLGAQIREVVFDALGEETLSHLSSAGNTIAEYYYALLLCCKNGPSQISDQLLSLSAQSNMPQALSFMAINELLNTNSIDNPIAAELFVKSIDYGYDYFALLQQINKTGYIYSDPENTYPMEDIVREMIKRRKRNRPFVLVKISKNEFAESLVNQGNVFTQSLVQFRKSAAPAVGDEFEGVAYTGNTLLGNGLQTDEAISSQSKLGIYFYDEYMAHERLFCLYALEWDEEGNIVKPDIRMRQFGDTAVLIWNVQEFINRFIKTANDAHDSPWISYGRVEYYDLDFEKNIIHSEFSKTEPYSWQNEFRFVVDIAKGRIERQEWNGADNKNDKEGTASKKESSMISHYEKIMEHVKGGMTDFAKTQYLNAGGRSDQYDDSGSDIIHLGPISDICKAFPIDDFINLSPNFLQYAMQGEKKSWKSIPKYPKPFAYRPVIKYGNGESL